MQVQRTSVGADSKVVVEGEKERMTLVIVANDDKVTSVLSELEEDNSFYNKVKSSHSLPHFE